MYVMNDGLNAFIGVQHTFAKSGGELVTFFDSYCDDGLNAVIGEKKIFFLFQHLLRNDTVCLV